MTGLDILVVGVYYWTWIAVIGGCILTPLLAAELIRKDYKVHRDAWLEWTREYSYKQWRLKQLGYLDEGDKEWKRRFR